MSNLRSCGWLTLDLDPALKAIFVFYPFRSIPTPAPVPSMSHLRSCGGVNSRSIFELQLFDLNLGSTSSLAPVTSMYHCTSCVGGSTLDLDTAPDPYFGLYLLTLNKGPLHLWLQSNLFLTLDHVKG